MNAQTLPPAVTPLALQNHTLLQALYEGGHKTIVALAAAITRDKDNVRKSLLVLAGEDLTYKPDDGAFWQLTIHGIDTLGAIGRMGSAADTPPVAPSSPPVDGIAGMFHCQIIIGDRNPRRDWDSEEAREALDELAASIKAEGRLLQNLVVRPKEPLEDWNVGGPEGATLPVYELVAGERRWRAIRQLIWAGDWPADRPLPVLIADLDDAGHDRVALIENLKRRDLKALEEARAYQRLTEGEDGLTTAELSRLINVNQRVIQQRLQLLKLSESDQLRLDAGTLKLEGARNILAGRPENPEPPTSGEINAALPVELDPHQELVLIEIQAAVALRPVENPLGPTASFDQDFKLAEWPPEAELAAQGFIAVSKSYPSTVTLLRPAQVYLDRMRFTMVTPEQRLRYAREGATLPEEAIAELERDETFDRNWLNERNPPEKLNAAETLLLLEVQDATSAWEGAEMQQGVSDARIDALVKRNLLHHPRAANHRLYLKRAWGSDKALERVCPGFQKKGVRAKHLERLRAEALGDASWEGKYVHSWLNGPFDLPADIQETLDREAAKKTEQEKRAEAQRQKEEQLAQRKADAVQRLEEEIATLSPDERQARFAEVLALVGAPAPWVDHDNRYYGIAKAANGHTVDTHGDITKRLLRIAVNIAAGADLASATEPPAPIDRATFVGWIADRLQELLPSWKPERCRSQAGHALDADLKDWGVEFGDDEYSWTRSEAEESAESWAERADENAPKTIAEEGDDAPTDDELDPFPERNMGDDDDDDVVIEIDEDEEA